MKTQEIDEKLMILLNRCETKGDIIAVRKFILSLLKKKDKESTAVIYALKESIDSWLYVCENPEIKTSFSDMDKASKKADKYLKNLPNL